MDGPPAPDPAAEAADDDPVEMLRRWTEFGAAWEVVQRTPEQAVVALLRCDGGEEVGRLVSQDPLLLAYLDRHR